MSNKKMTFAEKLKMQDECGSPEVEQKVEEVEVKPKKERKPRKKTEKKVEEKVEVIEVKEEEPKKERKSRKKQVLEGGSVETETKKQKEKRPPTAYNLFVKDAYKSKEVQKLPPNQRFAKVAELWHKEKAKKTKSKK